MTEFKQYRRKSISEMRPYVEGEILDEKVSISQADKDNGSPKVGDMIARNPKNHEDQWLVAKQYFEDNLEEIQTTTMKEQTLEEFINSQPYYGHCTPEYLEGIEAGAKWQQEKMFTEEQLAMAMLDFGLYIAENRGKPIDTDNKIKEIIEQYKQQEQ